MPNLFGHTYIHTLFFKIAVVISTPIARSYVLLFLQLILLCYDYVVLCVFNSIYN